MRHSRLLRGLLLATICAGGASSYDIATIVEELSADEAEEAGFTWSVLRSDHRCESGPRVSVRFPLEMWHRPPHTVSVLEVPPRNSLEVGRSVELEIETSGKTADGCGLSKPDHPVYLDVGYGLDYAPAVSFRMGPLYKPAR